MKKGLIFILLAVILQAWNDPQGLKGILDKLDSSKAGERIQILAHPDWWGIN